MGFAPRILQTRPVGLRPGLLAVLGATGIGLAVWSIVAFGPVMTAQIGLGFVVPAVILLLFWAQARRRVEELEEEIIADHAFDLALQRVAGNAHKQFLAGICHELAPHPERCSVRAEALAVAVEYRHLDPELKVAVPDLIVSTDPHMLRHVLHILVGNAVRHGGHRVAIWGDAGDGQSLTLTVSDDGPGLPPELEGRVLDRYLDLGGGEPAADGAGLGIARSLTELLGGKISYRRDRSWTHFSIHLPTGVSGRSRFPVRLEAGAR